MKIDRAYVRKANRAFVHRSHSGRYGEVNSEEGYQNLRRFLFGRYTVQVELCGLTLPGSPEDAVWQADVKLAVRGLPIVLHEQLAAHYCPVLLDKERVQHQDEADAPVPLARAFLLDQNDLDPADDRPSLRSRYTLSLKVFHVTEEYGRFLWTNHLEQVADWEDTLVVDVGRDGDTSTRAWIAWNSAVAGAIDSFDPITDGLVSEDQRRDTPFLRQGDALYCEIPLPEISRPILGNAARIRITVSQEMPDKETLG